MPILKSFENILQIRIVESKMMIFMALIARIFFTSKMYQIISHSTHFKLQFDPMNQNIRCIYVQIKQNLPPYYLINQLKVSHVEFS